MGTLWGASMADVADVGDGSGGQGGAQYAPQWTLLRLSRHGIPHERFVSAQQHVELQVSDVRRTEAENRYHPFLIQVLHHSWPYA